MSPRKPGYSNDVDEQIERTPLDLVLRHYGQDAPQHAGGEHRMQCVFNADCVDSTYGQLAVNQSTPAKVIFCHSCGIRGNLLTLIHGLKTGTPPTGNRLRGDEFKTAVATLQTINTSVDRAPPSSSTHSLSPTIAAAEHDQPAKRNPPLKTHEKEAARTLENLYEDLVTNVGNMSPNAGAYFRQREWLTPEVAAKWRMGFVPKNGRSLFKNWIVYAQHNEAGDVISYSGRDVSFDEKWRRWIQDGKPDGQRPAKHKYVSGYHRGLELYGQMASRLTDERLLNSLIERGLVVVEGANDVIRLDCLSVAAVGLCSNRATDEQLSKLVRFAQQQAKGRVVLMPDNDAEGTAGFMELSWKLMEQGLSVRLAWSENMDDGQFAGKQPEDITPEEWHGIDVSLRR